MSSSGDTPRSSVTTPDETYQSPCRGEVIDIGGSQLTDILKKVFQKKLIGKDDQNRHFLCDFFFSDDNGLAIWKKINCLPDYYQTDHEVELLKNHGKDIASYIKEGTAIIDLGCGDVRKVKPLLDHLEASGTNVQYYALDLSKKAVEDNMLCYSSNYKHVECFGLWGTFEDGMEWSKALQKPRLFLSLGSIFGNDRFQRAVKYLKMWAGSLRPADHILLGIDVCQSKEEVWNSYHDSGGLFQEFVRNAFEHSNRILGPWYKHDDWIVSGILEGDPHFHRFVLKAVNDVLYAPAGINFAVGDEVECYEEFKQTPVLMQQQFGLAGLDNIGWWSSSSGTIYKWSSSSL